MRAIRGRPPARDPKTVWRSARGARFTYRIHNRPYITSNPGPVESRRNVLISKKTSSHSGVLLHTSSMERNFGRHALLNIVGALSLHNRLHLVLSLSAGRNFIVRLEIFEGIWQTSVPSYMKDGHRRSMAWNTPGGDNHRRRYCMRSET